MTLISRLAVFALAAATLLPSASIAALKPGAAAPAFTAPAFMAGEPFAFVLADALKDGPVVVYFFPAANTPGCNLEASLFSQAIARFKAHGATVIGVTAGNTEALAAFSRDGSTCAGKFPVAADPGARIATRYDAVLEGRPELSSRTSYVISRSGEIVHAWSDSNPNRHVAETLAAVEALAGK
jgi:peroxiredoxin